MLPVLQSLWMVDSVEYDAETRRVNLHGIFDTIEVDEGVEFASGASVYFSVRGVHTEARMTLQYVDLSDGVVLLARPVRVEGTPLETTDVTVRFNDIPVPHEGAYAWELYYGIEPLVTLRVEVHVNHA